MYTALTVLRISSKSWLLKSWHICWTNLIWNEKSISFISNCSNLDSHHKGIKLMPFLSMNLSTFASQSSQLVNELQYSSQILKHLCDFPLPQCWFGYYSHLSAPTYAWLNIGEGEGHIRVRTKVWRVNVQNFPKIQENGFCFNDLWWVLLPVSQPVYQPHSQSVNQSVSQSVIQTVSQSIGQ